MALDIGIDLGTANVLIYVSGKGIVLNEPSVVAIDTNTNQVLAVGSEAYQMVGKTPSNIRAIRPLKDGVISDFDVTEEMLSYFIKKLNVRGIMSRPSIMICTQRIQLKLNVRRFCKLLKNPVVARSSWKLNLRWPQLVQEWIFSNHAVTWSSILVVGRATSRSYH